MPPIAAGCKRAKEDSLGAAGALSRLPFSDVVRAAAPGSEDECGGACAWYWSCKLAPALKVVTEAGAEVGWGCRGAWACEAQEEMDSRECVSGRGKGSEGMPHPAGALQALSVLLPMLVC
eukprot:1161319-Pelagomonas_calceolata.AAC.4